MNDMPFEPATWTASELADDAKSAFFKAALERRESAEKDARVVRRMGLLGAVGGAAVGILGMASGLTAYVKTPVQPPPGYIIMDHSTGWISQPVTARDAPKAFSDTTRERA